MLSIFVALLIFCVACWIIKQIPVPDAIFTTLLFVVAAVMLIGYLLRFV